METHKTYIDAIKKTGFVLENRVAQLLKTSGWTVISNKYYEDDHSSTVREVDLVAYKISHIQHFDVYTVLIVSCKKSEENVWAFLARDLNSKDPNSDWWPLHAWTNDPALDYRLAQTGCATRYHDEAAAAGVGVALSLPEVEVFAFQELSKATGAPAVQQKPKSGKADAKSASSPRNDAAIFSSITSLMKAQAYEIGALPNRKKTPSVYQFNLVTVAGTELLRMRFRGSEIECAPVQSEHYIGRYIINRRETFSRIRFIQADAFKEALKDYGRLHDANCAWFESECAAFYLEIVKDWKRTQVLIATFRKEISGFIRREVLNFRNENVDMSTANIEFSVSAQQVHITVDCSFGTVNFLQESPEVKKHVAVALKDVYRYTGPFEFELNIPF